MDSSEADVPEEKKKKKSKHKATSFQKKVSENLLDSICLRVVHTFAFIRGTGWITELLQLFHLQVLIGMHLF